MIGESSNVASKAAVKNFSSGGIVVQEVKVARVLVMGIDSLYRLLQIDDLSAILVDQSTLGNGLKSL